MESPSIRRTLALLALLTSSASAACARAPAATAAAPGVGALDKFGLYQARRIVLEPVETARIAPGDLRAEVSRVATVGRGRDARSILLLRFSVDLPPETKILEAHILLSQMPSVDADPAPISLHAARIAGPWDARSIAWGRAPRLEEARLPVAVAGEGSGVVRLDVGPLVRRWRAHARDDQGVAILADRVTATGMTFASADGDSYEDRTPVLPVRSRADSPPTFFAAAQSADGSSEPTPVLGPRLELYVRP